MSELSREAILNALRRVQHPGRGRDVVTLGMVSGVVVKGGHAGFALEVDPAEAAALEPLRRACEAAVKAVPGVLSCSAVLTAERAPGGGPAAPPPPPALGGARDRPAAQKPLVPSVARSSRWRAARAAWASRPRR